jgi:hypothetical protein
VSDSVLRGLVDALAAVIAIGLIFLMGKLTGGGTKKQPGQTILRYGWLVRGAGLLGGVIVVVCLLVFVIGRLTGMMVDQPGKVNPLLLLAGVFAFFGIPALLEGYRRQVTLNDDGITVRGWFGTAPTIRWEEITSIVNIPMAGKFYVRTAKGKTALSHYLDGLDVFAEECKKRLASSVYTNAFEKS